MRFVCAWNNFWRTPVSALPEPPGLSEELSKENANKMASFLASMSNHAEVEIVRRVECLMQENAELVDAKELNQVSISLRKSIRAHNDAIEREFSTVGALLQYCDGIKSEQCQECARLQIEARRYRLVLTKQLAPMFEALRATGGTVSYAFEVMRGLWDKNR